MNEKLLNARRAKKYKQKQIAELVGIDRSTYSHYERGRKPPLDVALRIAKILGRPVEKIFDIYVPTKHENTGT
jgi:putative transcriptional regulator